jgi:hypothetical protein
MLLNIRVLTEAGRALSVLTGQQLDIAKFGEGDAQAKASRYVGLLTPVSKAFLSDRGLDAAITAQQVFGGHGYIRETGIEQLVRDTRIAQIYEGTNGIQAIDFLGRKVTGDNLVALTEFVTECTDKLTSLTQVDESHKAKVIVLFDELLAAAKMVNDNKSTQPAIVNASAVDFLDAFGHILYGYFWLLMSDAASNELDAEFASQKRYLSDFYIAKMLPKAKYHLAQVREGDSTVMSMPENLF